MSDYSSDSDIDRDRQRRKVRWSDHQNRNQNQNRKSLHTILGGGKLADIILWKDKKVTAGIFGGLTAIWFLFEVVEYNFVTFLCHALLFSMLSIFLWFRTSWLINWDPPAIDEIKLSASTCKSLFTKVNWVLVNFYDISTGKDLKLFFLAICSLYMVSIIGAYVSTLNLFYIIVVCMETIPTLYERHEMEIGNVGHKIYKELQKLYILFDRTVLHKIPKGPLKQRKSY